MDAVATYSLKRPLDVAVALLLLVILSPLMLLIALVVRIAVGSPILFVQVRPGLMALPFSMYKFRTMSNERGADGKLLPDAERLGGFGRFLRSTSLDELPELINVLRGEMSLVGPRPLLMDYVPLYSPYQLRRHEARPGITGWAQVSGRNSLAWPERLRLDVWYVENASLLLDLKILAMTVSKVASRDGVTAAGHATMQPFKGEQ